MRSVWQQVEAMAPRAGDVSAQALWDWEGPAGLVWTLVHGATSQPVAFAVPDTLGLQWP